MKRYLVKPNDHVDAKEWWEAARAADSIPIRLFPLLLGLDRVAEVTAADLRWCRDLPCWDGIDGRALRIKRIRGRR